MKDLINQITNPETGKISFTNVDEVEAKGVEFEMETRLRNGLEARLAYTLQRATDEVTRQPLTNSPTHLAKFNFAAAVFTQRLSANLDLQYLSKRRTLDGTNLDALWLANLTFLSKRVTNGMDFSFSLYNLFNRRYGDPGSEEHALNSIQQDGRNFRMKVTYRF